MLGAAGTTQVVGLLVSPVLARLYTEADFAFFATFSSLVAMVVVVAGLRFEFAIPIAESDQDAATLLRICTSAVAGVAALTAIVTLLVDVGSISATLSGLPPSLILAIPVGILVFGLHQAITRWTVRLGAFSDLARAKVVQGFGGSGIQLALGLFWPGLGGLGLATGHILGRGLGATWLGVTSGRDWRRNRSLRADAPGSRALDLMQRYRGFPLVTAPSSWLNSVGSNAAPLLFVMLYGPQSGGEFAFTTRILGATVALASEAIAPVYHHVLAQVGAATDAGRHAVNAGRGMMKKLQWAMILIMAPAATLLIVIGPSVFAALFGERWTEAGQMARWLILGHTAQLLVSPFSLTFSALERHTFGISWSALRLVVVVATILMPSLASLSAERAVVSYSLGMVVMYVTMYAMIRRALGDAMRATVSHAEGDQVGTMDSRPEGRP